MTGASCGNCGLQSLVCSHVAGFSDVVARSPSMLDTVSRLCGSLWSLVSGLSLFSEVGVEEKAGENLRIFCLVNLRATTTTGNSSISIWWIWLYPVVWKKLPSRGNWTRSPASWVCLLTMQRTTEKYLCTKSTVALALLGAKVWGEGWLSLKPVTSYIAVYM